MEFLNSKKFILMMLIVLVWAGLSGCTPNTHPDKQSPHETEQEMNASITKDMDAIDRDKAQADNDQPADFESIVDALGCTFNPTDCPLKKRKDEQNMDR